MSRTSWPSGSGWRFLGRARVAAAQLQDGVADLLAGEEPLAAAQLVADAGRGQRLFVGLGLAVGAEQHGDLAGRGAGVEQLADPARPPWRPRPRRRSIR